MKRQISLLISLLVALVLLGVPASAQRQTSAAGHILWGSSLPATCNPATGDVFFKTSGAVGIYQCTATNTWKQIAGLASPSFSGTTTFVRTINTSVVLTDAATIAVDASLGNNFRVTLADNRTLGNPTNAIDGQTLSFEVIQDGTGSRTLAFDTKFAFGTDITGCTLTTAASKRDFITVYYNSTADKFYVRGCVKGY